MSARTKSLLNKILTHEVTATTPAKQQYWSKHWVKLFFMAQVH